MATCKNTAPAGAQSQSAIDTALHGMEEVSGILLTVRRALDLNDEAAEERQTLIVADRLLTETHDALERAEMGEPAGTPAPAEPAPPVDAEASQAAVERLVAFDATPVGQALSDTEEALSVAVALVDCATRSLERDDGNGIDHETSVLGHALERLQDAMKALDVARSTGVNAFQPAASEAQS